MGERSPTSGEEAMRLADQHLHSCEQPRYLSHREKKLSKTSLMNVHMFRAKKKKKSEPPKDSHHRDSQCFIVKMYLIISNTTSMGAYG